MELLCPFLNQNSTNDRIKKKLTAQSRKPHEAEAPVIYSAFRHTQHHLSNTSNPTTPPLPAQANHSF